MTNEDTFKYSAIDEIAHDEDLIEKTIETVKSIPNSVLRLEKFYDLQDNFKGVPNCKTNSSCLRYETINLGTDSNTQSVNLGTDCTPLEKSAFVEFFKEYIDIFAWTYDYLKTFNPQIM